LASPRPRVGRSGDRRAHGRVPAAKLQLADGVRDLRRDHPDDAAALPFLRSPQLASKQELEESLGTVLVRAFKDPSYTLIFLGFFSCGYQLAFITAHFPAFVTELCSPIDAGGMLAGSASPRPRRWGRWQSR
jgi:hypothetical protein